MAKGDGQGGDIMGFLQQVMQDPNLIQQIQGIAGQQNAAGRITGNSMQQAVTGNPQNFMAGLRKTMGNPNPVNPYGFVPPSMRGGNEMNNPMGGRNSVIARQAPPAPQMNMPGSNTGFQGNQNTGITGGMNRTYGPMTPPSTSDGMGMQPYTPPSLGMTQNNPYAPKMSFGQVGQRPY